MKNATDYPTNTAIALLLAGETGSGKSTSLFNWPKPYVEDLEGNLKGAVEHHRSLGTLPEFKWNRPELADDGKPLEEKLQYDNVKRHIQQALADPSIQTVCVDGLGKLCDLLKAKLVWEPNAAEKPLVVGGERVMSMSLWQPFANGLKRLIWMARAANKPFIVTAHLTVDENELTSVKEQRVNLQGQLKSDFPKLFSDFWSAFVVTCTKDAKHPRGVSYKIRTAPTMRIPSLKTSFTGVPDEFEVGDEAFTALMKRIIPA
jgi:hypothetical protein